MNPVPELQPISLGLYDLVFYGLVVAGFALFAYFVYSWKTTSEVSPKYRPAALAGLLIAGVASLSYLVLAIKWDTGYDLVGNLYQPNAEARLALAPRYMDWSVTVPLLTLELLAVCALAGSKARALRLTTMAAAFLMIITGYFGAQTLSQGRSVTALVVWGIISSLFYLYLYIALIGAVGKSRSAMSPATFTSLRNASFVLLGTFGVYPLVYAIPVFFDTTGAWLAGIQLAYSAADILAKVGFGMLIHKVAKLRSAEDVDAGLDVTPEATYVSQVKVAPALLPPMGETASAHLGERAGHARTATATTGTATGTTGAAEVRGR